jgi:hypothetical protein
MPVILATHNPSYSGGRGQKDQGLNSALGKWFMRPYLEKTHP